MISLTVSQFKTLHYWFADEGPGDMTGQHVMNTGRFFTAESQSSQR